jgi:CDP-paratose 2-epimerase
LRYIGFDGTGKQVRDAFHPRDLCSLLEAQINAGPAGRRRIFNVGGGSRNATSLCGLNDWCDRRFGPHRPQADSLPRPYDIPWLVMDNREAETAFGWRAEISLECILTEIAQHAERFPDWLDTTNA